MKVAAMFGDGAAGLVDRPDPRPRDQFVLVEVRAVLQLMNRAGHWGETHSPLRVNNPG